MLSLLHGSQQFKCQSSLLLPVSCQVAAMGNTLSVLIGTYWKGSGDINDKSLLHTLFLHIAKWLMAVFVLTVHDQKYAFPKTYPHYTTEGRIQSNLLQMRPVPFSSPKKYNKCNFPRNALSILISCWKKGCYINAPVLYGTINWGEWILLRVKISECVITLIMTHSE